MKPARGIQNNDAKMMDDKEMVRDRMVISTTTGLRVIISSIALMNPVAISSNLFTLTHATAQEALVGAAHSAAEQPINSQLPLAGKNNG